MNEEFDNLSISGQIIYLYQYMYRNLDTSLDTAVLGRDFEFFRTIIEIWVFRSSQYNFSEVNHEMDNILNFIEVNEIIDLKVFNEDEELLTLFKLACFK